jgi:type II secretory pathway pseudopilin PulG
MEKDRKRNVEILGIFLILGVIAAVIIFSQQAKQGEERDRTLLDDIKDVRIALQQYYEEKGVFPETIPGEATEPQAYTYQCITEAGGACTEGKCRAEGLCADYVLRFRIEYGSERYGKGVYAANKGGVVFVGP